MNSKVEEDLDVVGACISIFQQHPTATHAKQGTYSALLLVVNYVAVFSHIFHLNIETRDIFLCAEVVPEGCRLRDRQSFAFVM